VDQQANSSVIARIIVQGFGYKLAIHKGLSFKLSMGSVISLYPALITTREQMRQALGIIDECLCELDA